MTLREKGAPQDSMNVVFLMTAKKLYGASSGPIKLIAHVGHLTNDTHAILCRGSMKPSIPICYVFHNMNT